MNIGLARLHSQRLAGSSFTSVEQVVSWLVGLQGQDAASVKWSIGLRLPGSTEADVEKALAAGRVVRTWPMRGTLHLVAAADVRWLVALTGPGNLARAESRRRALELDDATLARSRKIFVKALRDGKHHSRDELYALLEKSRISTAGQRGYHLLWHAAVRGLICSGASRGKEPTFALLEQWVPPTPEKTREEAVAELARRYLASRAPATLEDFAWWSGLGKREARAGFAEAGEVKEDSAAVKGAFALPGFDEFLLGYQDRSAVLEPKFRERWCPGGNGVFAPSLVLGGRVVGTWKRSGEIAPFKKLEKRELRSVEAAIARYTAFKASPLSRAGERETGGTVAS